MGAIMHEDDRTARGIGPSVATIVVIVVAIVGSFYVGFNYSRAGKQAAAIETDQSDW